MHSKKTSINVGETKPGKKSLLTKIILVSSSSACTLVIASASRGFCRTVNKLKLLDVIKCAVVYKSSSLKCTE